MIDGMDDRLVFVDDYRLVASQAICLGLGLHTTSNTVAVVKITMERADGKHSLQYIMEKLTCSAAARKVFKAVAVTVACQFGSVRVRRSASAFVAGRAQSCGLPLLRAASADQSGTVIGRSPTETFRTRLSVPGCAAHLPTTGRQSLGVHRVVCIVALAAHVCPSLSVGALPDSLLAASSSFGV
nr:unnamed protein product [Callosobruchus chinensis]